MTITRTHPCDGAAGTSATTAGEGFTSISGTAPIYTSDGNYLQWPGGSVAYAQDSLTDPFVGFYVRVPSTLTTAAALVSGQASGTSQGSLIINPDLSLSLYSSLGTHITDSTSKLTIGQRCRIEWNVSTSTQELRLFLNPDAVTPTETLTGAAGATAINMWRYGSWWAANNGGPVDLDQITVADTWPNLGVSDGGAQTTSLRIGGAWVPATREVLVGGIWVAMTATPVTAGAPAQGDTFPMTFPFTLT